jgi:hypothetical protein
LRDDDRLLGGRCGSSSVGDGQCDRDAPRGCGAGEADFGPCGIGCAVAVEVPLVLCDLAVRIARTGAVKRDGLSGVAPIRGRPREVDSK